MNQRFLYCICFLLIIFPSCIFGQITWNEVYVEYDSAVQYKNLKVIPIKHRAGPGLPVKDNELKNIITLEQALKTKKAKVEEHGNFMVEDIGWVTVENNSNQNIYIQSGDLLIGGKQDRVFAKDTILQPMKGKQKVSVFCVEDGRWSREKKFKSRGSVDHSLKKVIDSSQNQTQVWNKVRQRIYQRKLKTTTGSYAKIVLDKKVLDSTDDYVKYFTEQFAKKDSSVVGVVCISGGKILGCDIFVNHQLFFIAFHNMIEGYCQEAILYGSIPRVPDGEVKKYMDKVLDPDKQMDYLKKHGKIFRQFGHIIHIKSFSEE